MNRPHVSIVVIVVALIVGGWQVAQGAYIYAKAELAQILLGGAWRESKISQQRVKPWFWADTWPVAKLEIPGHAIDLIVLAGDTGRTLAFAPGYNLASARPGEEGNSIISGHRDTHFEFLQHLATNDKIIVENKRGVRKIFSVSRIYIVDSRKTTIAIDADNPVLTLVTCYPFETLNTGGPLRFVVEAEVI